MFQIDMPRDRLLERGIQRHCAKRLRPDEVPARAERDDWRSIAAFRCCGCGGFRDILTSGDRCCDGFNTQRPISRKIAMSSWVEVFHTRETSRFSMARRPFFAVVVKYMFRVVRYGM